MIMHHLSRKSFVEVIIFLQFRLDVVIDAPLGYTVWYTFFSWFYIIWFFMILTFALYIFSEKKPKLFCYLDVLIGFIRNKSNRLWFCSHFWHYLAYLSISIRRCKGQSHNFFSQVFSFLILIIIMRQWAILNVKWYARYRAHKSLLCKKCSHHI